MTATDDLLANNESYVGSFDKGDLPLPPARKVAVIACMDARLHVSDILGLEVLYGGKNSSFSSLRTSAANDVILNLEGGLARRGWGRIIFLQ